MKKIVKLKESKVLEIVNKIINEETAPGQPIAITASGTLGVAPTFEGLKQIQKDLRTKVTNALRGNTPYKIKTDNPDGLARCGKSGDNGFSMTITLIPAQEADRDWFFDTALGVYSYVNSGAVDIFRAKVNDLASRKGANFEGAENKVTVLAKNIIPFRNFTGLNPNEPDKEYKMFIVYIGAKKPDGYVPLYNDDDVKTTEPTQTTAPYKVGDVLKGIRSTDNKEYQINVAELGKGYMLATITGPGTYENQAMSSGLKLELNTNTPGELSGNMELGTFKIVK